MRRLDLYEPNLKGVDYVVGDIHGMYQELKDCMQEWGFNKEVDRLFSVGDLIDRGPDSEKVLGLLQEEWFYPVIGNHEKMMIDAIRSGNNYLWVANGGDWCTPYLDTPIPQVLVESILELPYAIEITLPTGEQIGICHAEPPTGDWSDMCIFGKLTSNEKERMLWGRTRITDSDAENIKNIDLTIHGHTPTKEITMVKNSVFIDLGCFYSGKLCMVPIKNLLEVK